MSELSLPAQAYLLACDVERERLPDRERAALLVRGAALTDLVLRGLVADADGRPVVTGSGGTGHLVLDDLLAAISADPHRRWRSWVRRDARGTLQSVEAQLEAAGVLSVRTSNVLGLFPRRRPVVRDRGSVERLKALVLNAFEAPVSEVDPSAAALAALVATAELNTVISRQDRRRYRERIEELGERGGAAVPALRKVLREVRAARTAAVSAASGGGG